MAAKKRDETAQGTQGEQAGFEDCLGDLEQIVRRLEDGQLNLDEALQQYERGVGLLHRCHGLLAEAERRVELLAQTNEAGTPEVVPFQEDALTLEEKAAQRHRRRSLGADDPGSGARPDIDERGQLF